MKTPKTTETAPEPYPEHVKLRSVAPSSQAQGEFVDWLRERGVILAKYDGNKLWPDTTPIADHLANYHNGDQQKLESEKRAMIDAMRTNNQHPTS